ncbi:baseplate protein [Pseudoroseomonas rhizosphaerae]|uniref:Baseplate protein n=1 Tax=Teichococcus rhizosphaerae TaxID=1335062 RepID=A0A2C7A4L0_9PROT|nr:baseplate J/gp47 family protein [Pseudoroseomonas rhizosphaerae]PHK92899.1 baseplate protein [Pseudoroseomonas rhizosphaerae]
MELNTRTHDQLVQQQITAMQAELPGQDLNTTSGSILRSLFNAVAAVMLWLQLIAYEVLSVTRLSTSTGTDVDSWLADWEVQQRQAATYATGVTKWERNSAPRALGLPVGAMCRTDDGSRTALVIADTGHDYWSADVGSQGGYLVPADVYAVDVPAEAIEAGVAGNVLAGAYTRIGSNASGWDRVSNPAAFSGGVDAESDESCRARFRAYIASLHRGTGISILTAAASVKQGLSFRLVENVDAAGNWSPGRFLLVVSDPSATGGQPSSELLSAIYAAVDAVRPVTVVPAIIGPLRTTASVRLTIEVNEGYDKDTLLTPIAQAVTAYINGLGIGAPLRMSRITNAAFGVSPDGIANVANLTVNGIAGDVDPGKLGQVVAGPVVVS